MTVWYITMLFPAPSETFACNDVRALRSAGIDISVHSLRPKRRDTDALLRERHLHGLRLSHTHASTLQRGLQTIFTRPAASMSFVAWLVRHTYRKPTHLLKSLMVMPRIFELFSGIASERPDVVHIYWGHYPALLGHLVQRYLPDTIVSMSLAAYDLEMAFGASRPVAARADVLRTHARANLDRLQTLYGIGPERVHVVYNGLDLNRHARRASHTAKVEKRIVTAGRLIEEKCVNQVLRAFASIRKEHPEATLRILGDGPERSRLAQLALRLGVAGAVTFLGHVRHEEVFEELHRAQVFLFMSKSRSERLPNVVKEAMASRCACIVSDTLGISELIPDAGHGIVVEPDDFEAAARHASALFADPAAMASMGTRARAYVERVFDLQATSGQYITLWREALARKRGPDTPAVPWPSMAEAS